ncbi:SDR family oxidoreductase [Ottowia sp.]|uniref:SDR family NAD(P)-dependent oxidoreductase n=1 Tax=Ottowia sp. TaxID=1898956 RepID=UPI0025FBABA6|nr:SDR family oxidoreductase [Ottowia sp.]MBK6747004.1 SDR family oxidoreductase [Ottowia sp.]
MRLVNKCGIITAAASGIGRAGAIRFAHEGAKVLVVDRDQRAAEETVAAIRATGGAAVAAIGDLTQEDFARQIVRTCQEEFGGVDFLWPNAGHPGAAAVEGLDLADFDLAINLNLRAALASVVEAVPLMRQRGGGSVLFTASTSGLVGSPVSPVYSAAKFGIVGLMKSLSKRFGRDGIRFNAVCPTATDTPMLRVFVKQPDDEAAQNEDVEELVKKRATGNAFGRTAKPEEIASAALFLISDEASFITGVALPIDAGATA